jgi:UDP-N-acetylglucosamine--N-acetylmuramyl-(pentapeptide) pyrophosphoryl-undecaprenol N-acetylglucosamine transferase
VAAVLAARLRGTPTILREQNAFPGVANRWLGRVARRVCVGFAEAARFFPAGRAVHTGNPIRGRLLSGAPRAGGAPTGLLVFGGSQGAHRLNEATLEAARIIGATAATIAIVHQTGREDVERVRGGYAALGLAARVEPFIADMGAVYAAADVALSRAGAMSCAELTAVGLPAILVPYPFAADDHQRRNAEVLVAGGAAEMILDRELTGARLAAALVPLLEDAARRARMAAAARALGRPDAARHVADECLRLVSA